MADLKVVEMADMKVVEMADLKVDLKAAHWAVRQVDL